MRFLLCVLVLFATSTVPTVAQQAVSDRFLITPGLGIGPIRLGMNITEAVSILGTPKVTRGLPDARTLYLWFEDVSLGNGMSRTIPNANGLFVGAVPSGEIARVIAHYAPQYSTSNGLHTGIREAQVRATLGEPHKVRPATSGRWLEYDRIEFLVVDSPQVNGYQTVVEVQVD